MTYSLNISAFVDVLNSYLTILSHETSSLSHVMTPNPTL